MAGSVLNKQNDGSTPPPITMDSVLSEVGKVIDAKLSGSLENFRKNNIDTLKAQVEPLTTQMTTINESLRELLAKGSLPPSGTNSDGKPPVPPEINAQLRDLTDRIKSQGNELNTLKVAKEQAEQRAEKTERHSTIRTALNGLPFVTDKAVDTAFSIVEPYVRRLEDGSLVAGLDGENYPVNSFVQDFLSKEHGYLFKSTGASGSGAPPIGSGSRIGPKADISSIKVGMKSEDRDNVVEAIASVLANS